MEYKDIAKIYRELAEIAEEMAALEEREKSGEDVTEEMETLLGRLMIKAMKLQK